MPSRMPPRNPSGNPASGPSTNSADDPAAAMIFAFRLALRNCPFDTAACTMPTFSKSQSMPRLAMASCVNSTADSANWNSARTFSLRNSSASSAGSAAMEFVT